MEVVNITRARRGARTGQVETRGTRKPEEGPESSTSSRRTQGADPPVACKSGTLKLDWKQRRAAPRHASGKMRSRAE
eukprot:4941286-Pyramimonas_sp.AAC.1